jgi:tetratricopeptide (TPR) repeat protein
MPPFSSDPAVHASLSASRRATGDELGALAHSIAALTLQAHAAGTMNDGARALCDVATGYFMKGDHAQAAGWYGLALRLNDALAPAWQNLAAIHADAGRHPEAAACRARAYALQRVFVEGAGAPDGQIKPRVLILAVGDTAGNVPVETLLPTSRFCRIKYVLDHADPAEDTALPPYDLVFNAIGEADVASPLRARLDAFIAVNTRPLLNAPARVEDSARDRLPALLAGLPGVFTATCRRAVGDDAARAAAAAIGYPLLLRPAASHGGIGLIRCDGEAALGQALDQSTAPEHYFTAFHDTRGADGCYRKYRMIFIGGRAYPYHLAISAQWMVHYFSADMEGHDWKIAAERRFLDDPVAELGPRALAAVAAVGERLGLDYAGVDFTVLADGGIAVFEANATMLVHRERANGPLAHKNAHVQRIVDAFAALIASKV